MENAQIKTPNTLIDHLFSEFLLTMRSAQYSTETVDKYEAILKLFRRFLSTNYQLEEIKVSTIRVYFASLTCGRKTALNYHTTLSAFWRWCVKNGYAEENIVRKAVQIRPSSEAEILPFSRDDVAALLRAARRGNSPKREVAVLLFLLDTGIRASELCNIVLSDIFWVTSKVIVRHGKGDKERVLKFSERTKDALLTYLDSRGLPEDKCVGTSPLFITKERVAFKRARLRKVIDKLSRDSGVVNAHAHRFRHTFAIQFLRNGGNIFTLQKLLGHTTLEMCKRYLAISQIDLDGDMEKASPVSNWRL